MSDVIYVNWANECESNHDALDLCDSTWYNNDIDRLLELLSANVGAETEIYFGPEFHRDIEKLEKAVSWCNERKKIPALFTYGLWFYDDELCARTIEQIKKNGNFRIIVLIDRDHERFFSAKNLSNFICEAKKKNITPEVMYVADDASFPVYIYESEEVKKMMSVYFNRASSGRKFLDNFARIESKSKNVTKHDENISSSDAASEINSARKNNNIYFNNIVLEITYLCNSQCDHCYTSCGPQADRTLMPLDKIERTLLEAASIDSINKRLHVAGGEPTLFWKEMETILCVARDLGYKNSIVTNGFWGKDREKAKKLVKRLKEAGVIEIELSIDAMHQQYTGNKSIHHILEAVEMYGGIDMILSLCTARHDNTSEILRQIDCALLNNVNITTRQVVSVGRAKQTFSESDLYLEEGIPTGSCNQWLNLTITPNGDVYPCCGGSELCPSLRMGNCFSDNLQFVLEQSKFNYMLRVLIHAGPAYFANMLLDNGYGHLLRPTYGNFCHLCNDIFSDEEKIHIVQKLFGKRFDK